MKFFTKRRGLSEIVSAVLIIVITVVGMAIYVIAAQQNILSDSISVKDALQTTKDRTGELLESVTIFNSTDGKELNAFLFNYGTKNITIAEIYVNGTQNVARSAFHVRDLQNNIILPQNNTIPKSKTVELVLDLTGIIDAKKIQNLVLKTDSNKLIKINREE